MNTEKLQNSWNNYKSQFYNPDSKYDEKYKWELLKKVSDKWNWNVDNKFEMFHNAFDTKGNSNLWNSVNYYPITMAERFFEEFPETTLQAFDALFDEQNNLLNRLKAFKLYFDQKLKELQKLYPDKTLKYHSQDIRSMSLFLFLQNPNKYALFKYSFVKAFSEQFDFETIRKGQFENYITYLGIVLEIKNLITADPFIPIYLENNKENDLYVDDSLHLLIQDFMYCTVSYDIDSKKKYWLYSPGEQAYLWEEFYELGIMALGWDELGDLNNYENREEISKALFNIYGGKEFKPNNTTANDEFLNYIDKGDIVIVKKGRSQLLGYGIVVSDYFYDDERSKYKHCRKIDWRRKGEWNVANTMVLKTLTDITSLDSKLIEGKKYYEYLLSIMNNELIETSNPNMELLKYKKQIILQGPPGTGKTREAERIAKEMLGLSDVEELKNNDQYKLVQFHPSYTYEDFVRGIVAKPNPEGEGILYEAENKVLGIIAEKALDNYILSKNNSGVSISKDAFKEFINYVISQIDEKEKFMISDKVYIYYVDDKRFKYKGDKWTAHPKGLNMNFSQLRKILEFELNSRQEINKSELLNSLTRQHATYYQNVVELYKKFIDEHPIVESSAITPKDFVLIIDEINRANLSSVLGELIYALEYREKAVESMYSVEDSVLDNKNHIILPPNLYIIGTMNTADRSVGHIDYAIRRRFAFVDVLPRDLSSDSDVEFDSELFEAVKALFTTNEYITRSKYLSMEFEPKDVALGHSYFIDKSSEGGDMTTRLEYEIKPILLEYVKDGVLIGDDIIQKIEELIPSL